MQTLNNVTILARDVGKTFYPNRFGSEFALGLKSRRKSVDAVRGVSFYTSKGDALGVLGRNGSGKSTLLNMVAGNETASTGQILTAATPTLLSVAAVLQPHLSGIHNVRLGLLAQGTDKKRVAQIETEVAEWAQIGDAINRPLKTYSSGMKARLKFSIATAVRPPILLVDEALATGDAAFTSRAKARMDSFLEDSGTVVIVSHSPGSIRQHCNRAIWLHLGEIIADGSVQDVGEQYAEWSKLVAQDRNSDADTLIAEVRDNYTKPTIILESEASRFMAPVHTR